MGCGCRKSAAPAASKQASSYLVTYPVELNRSSEQFLTDLEARRAIRQAGGGTIRMCKDGNCAA